MHKFPSNFSWFFHGMFYAFFTIRICSGVFPPSHNPYWGVLWWGLWGRVFLCLIEGKILLLGVVTWFEDGKIVLDPSKRSKPWPHVSGTPLYLGRNCWNCPVIGIDGRTWERCGVGGRGDRTSRDFYTVCPWIAILLLRTTWSTAHHWNMLVWRCR